MNNLHKDVFTAPPWRATIRKQVFRHVIPHTQLRYVHTNIIMMINIGIYHILYNPTLDDLDMIPKGIFKNIQLENIL